MNLLTAAAREQGTTVILVTHDARVAAYADREVIVRDGTVSSLTGSIRRQPGPAGRRRDPPRPAPGGQRRPGGRHPPGHPGDRGRARRRPAADRRSPAINAVNAQNGRHAWLWTGPDQPSPPGTRQPARRRCGGAPAAMNSTARPSVRVDVAATGPPHRCRRASPATPAPGQYYVSPALAALLRSTPADRARRPLPRPQAGTIGQAGAAVPGLAVHHRRPLRRADGPHARRHRR